jgi:Dehydrogenases (flavoproteins)
MERVDVAIVGGGPAGNAAAEAAAAEGAETLLLEKGVPRADREGMGPDSTDAAGLLDYWIDLMEFEPEELPEDVIHQRLEGADFIGPSTELPIEDTNIDSSFPDFGVAFHRARFDDWLRERAEAAGAHYRIGDSVTSVETTLNGSVEHELALANGETVRAEQLILADGPQRTVTIETVEQFTRSEVSIADRLDPSAVNHIAYQEYRAIPEELFDPARLKFWWGVMPGHTAYPWVFPNDEPVARVGLTMPIGQDIDAHDPDEWALLEESDESTPRGATYIERLLEREYPAYDLADFPLVEDRGKRGGTETYPISSTRPIESPVGANVAVVGGAMGGTSAFHEGGDHVAVRTGKIAGRLAATDELGRYNDTWREALEAEFLRNVTMAELVEDYRPADWDRAFATADAVLHREDSSWRDVAAGGLRGANLLRKYKQAKRRLGDGNYVQVSEADYGV